VAGLHLSNCQPNTEASSPRPCRVAPQGRCTFYVLEGRREPDGNLLLFGFCVSALGPACDELGYASLQELESVRRPLGLGFERDLYFKPTPLSEIMNERR
jgi:DUF2958 family protein